MVKKKYMFEPEPDIYTSYEYRLNNGYQKQTYYTKNGRLCDVFGNYILQSSLPRKYSIAPTYIPKTYKGSKKNKKMSAQYQSGMTSSQLLDYNLKNYLQNNSI